MTPASRLGSEAGKLVNRGGRLRVDLRRSSAVGTGPTSHLAQISAADLHVPVLGQPASVTFRSAMLSNRARWV